MPQPILEETEELDNRKLPVTSSPVITSKCEIPFITPNTPLIHASFTYSKLIMDDFSVLACPFGYVDSTQEVEV